MQVPKECNLPETEQTGGGLRKLEQEGRMEQDLVGFPPEARRKMMKWTENPMTFAEFRATNDVLGAKSGTWREETGRHNLVAKKGLDLMDFIEKEGGKVPETNK